MASQNEIAVVSDVLKWETDSRFCRETITTKIDAGETEDWAVGQVLQVDTGEYKKCIAGSSAAAILLEKIPFATIVAGTSSAVVLLRGPAIVDKAGLVVLSAQEVTAIVALEALEILTRTGPTYTTL